MSKATHSCPARVNRRATFEPMRPKPTIPRFMVTPEQHSRHAYDAFRRPQIEGVRALE
jgi:hypothetical protein